MSTQNLPQIEVLDTPFFQAFGFLVLRHFFDPRLIAAEIDQVMRNRRRSWFEGPGGGEIHFRYVPMMTAKTPAAYGCLIVLSLLRQPCLVALSFRRGPRECAIGATRHGTPIPILRSRVSASLPRISSRKQWRTPHITRVTSSGVRQRTPRIRSRR